ncbi:MAG: hypothetical protein M3Q10_00480, partial [Chloroflexota bacterium]|nr:hypothetical protein [Chloroflexota bacterium]
MDPALPAELGYPSNTIVHTPPTTTSSARITRRRNLLIDVDPVRADDTGDSATDAERDAALAVRDEIKGWLAGLGWPEPVSVAMSGNGGALVYRIDLPNDEAARGLVDGVLRALAARFDTEAASVDTGVGNADRLTKVVGTVARKGAGTPERPHRLATGETNPEAGPVPVGALRALAATIAKPAGGSSADGHPIDIRERLAALGVGYREMERSYGTALDLDRCLTSDAHDSGACIVEFKDGGLAYRCLHNSCADKGWEDVEPILGPRPKKEKGGGKPSQATLLVGMVEEEGVELFHAPDGAPYATFEIAGHRETYAFRDTGFRRYLSRLFYERTGGVPGRQAVADAVGVFEGQAVYE